MRVPVCGGSFKGDAILFGVWKGTHFFWRCPSVALLLFADGYLRLATVSPHPLLLTTTYYHLPVCTTIFLYKLRLRCFRAGFQVFMVLGLQGSRFRSKFYGPPKQLMRQTKELVELCIERRQACHLREQLEP